MTKIMTKQNNTSASVPPVPSAGELREIAKGHRQGEAIYQAPTIKNHHRISAWACEQMANQLDAAAPPKPLPNARDAAVEAIVEYVNASIVNIPADRVQRAWEILRRIADAHQSAATARAGSAKEGAE